MATPHRRAMPPTSKYAANEAFIPAFCGTELLGGRLHSLHVLGVLDFPENVQ